MILNTMWPMLLDMSRDECKRILRRLELEAYSSIVSALRAQGALTKEKRKILQDLATILNISLERHRAEVRRAVNDEKLETIAEHMAGPNTSTEWAIEGRRLIPLMPRLVPQTAFTALANKMANITATENAKLPPPAQTLRLKASSEEPLLAESSHDTVCGARHSASASGPNLLQLKRTDKEEERVAKRRCRSSSSSECIIGGPGQAMSPSLPRAKVALASPTQSFTPQQQPCQPQHHLQLQPQNPSLPQQHLQTVHCHHPQSHRSEQQPHPQQLCMQQPLSQTLLSHQQPQAQTQKQLQHHQQQKQLLSLPPPKNQPPQPLLQPPPPPPPPPPQQQQQQKQQQLLTPSTPPPTPSQPQSQPQQQQQLQQQLQPQLQQQLQPQLQQQQHQLQPPLPLHQQSQQLQHQFMPNVNQEVNKDLHPLNSQSVQNSPAPQMATMKIQEAAVGAQASPAAPGQAQATGHTRVISGGSGNAPVKITFTSSAGRAALCNIGTGTTTTLTTTTPAPTTQKVIIVQSSGTGGGGPGAPSILQRSLTVPVVKSSPAAAAGGNSNAASRASLIISGPTGSPPVTPTTIVTISTNPVNSNNVTATTVSIGGVPTTAYITSPGTIPHIRPKSVQLPSRMRPRAGSIVIPVTPNPLGGTGSLPGVTLKTTPAQSSRSGMHVKTECSSMKIVPVAAGSGGTTKILPKPSFGSGNSQTPVYMMGNTTSSITMVTRTISASCPGSRLVTVNATTLPSSVSTLQGRPITTTLVSKAASVTGSGRAPTAGKPNVIVVQKGSGGSFPRGVTVSGGRVQNFPATLQDVLSKVVGTKALAISGSGNSSSPLVTTLGMQKAQQQGIHLPANSTAGNVVVLDLSHENVGKNMVLADILQASGITGDADMDPGVEKGEKQGEQSVVSLSSNHPVSANLSQNIQLNKSNPGGLQGSRLGGEIVEVTGELDPQTGIYSIHPEPVSDLVSQGSSVTIVPSSSSGSMDIFSTALASADINLDSFQYMEEGFETISEAAQPSSSIEVTVGEDNSQVQVVGETLHFLQETDVGVSEPAAVTVEPSHIDTTGMHIEDFTSQKVQGQGAID